MAATVPALPLEGALSSNSTRTWSLDAMLESCAATGAAMASAKAVAVQSRVFFKAFSPVWDTGPLGRPVVVPQRAGSAQCQGLGSPGEVKLNADQEARQGVNRDRALVFRVPLRYNIIRKHSSTPSGTL